MTDPTLIAQVQAAASAAGNVSGNADAASFYVGTPNRLADVVRELEWAADNVKSAVHRINEALATARRLQEGGAT